MKLFMYSEKRSDKGNIVTVVTDGKIPTIKDKNGKEIELLGSQNFGYLITKESLGFTRGEQVCEGTINEDGKVEL